MRSCVYPRNQFKGVQWDKACVASMAEMLLGGLLRFSTMTFGTHIFFAVGSRNRRQARMFEVCIGGREELLGQEIEARKEKHGVWLPIKLPDETYPRPPLPRWCQYDALLALADTLGHHRGNGGQEDDRWFRHVGRFSRDPDPLPLHSSKPSPMGGAAVSRTQWGRQQHFGS